jgi:cell wall assembly regulator SMI1
VRVLTIAADGLVTPLGDGGWTATDLAAELRAPVVIVTGTDTDAVGHTILMLDALETRRIPASVIAVGDGGDFSALPVRLAGQLPADAADHRDRFAEAAREWVDPLTGTPRPEEPQGEAPVHTTPVKPDLQTRIAKKAAWSMLVAFFLALLLLFLCDSSIIGTFTTAELNRRPSEVRRTYGASEYRAPPVYPSATRPRRTASQVCPTNGPGASAAAADARAAARADAAWTRIERWLAANAPATHRTLRPPATPERIAAAQAHLSTAFPPDLVASLRRHDGVEATAAAFTLPPFFRPLPLDHLVREWTVDCQVTADLAPTPFGWHRAFVPFAADGSGGVLIVDQRPGGHGRVGRFDPEMGGPGFEQWPASLADLLEKVATSLETGTPYDGRYRPTVAAGGVLDWIV